MGWADEATICITVSALDECMEEDPLDEEEEEEEPFGRSPILDLTDEGEGRRNGVDEGLGSDATPSLKTTSM